MASFINSRKLGLQEETRGGRWIRERFAQSGMVRWTQRSFLRGQPLMPRTVASAGGGRARAGGPASCGGEHARIRCRGDVTEDLVLRHRGKQGQENAFKGPLVDMDLHHPPCRGYRANQTFYALGWIAQILLRALQFTALPKTGAQARSARGDPARHANRGAHGALGRAGGACASPGPTPPRLAVRGDDAPGGPRAAGVGGVTGPPSVRRRRAVRTRSAAARQAAFGSPLHALSVRHPAAACDSGGVSPTVATAAPIPTSTRLTGDKGLLGTNRARWL